MKFVLHQIRKDLHYIRRLLAGWLALLLGAAAARVLELDLLLYPTEWTQGVLRILATLGPVTTILGWFLTVRVVHADPVDGTTAFWLTRPLSRRALWLSKLLLVTALFVVLPAATSGLVVAAAGGVESVLRTLAERALLDAVFLFSAVWLAALTRDVARLVIAGVMGWIGWAYVHLLLLETEAVAAGAELEWTLTVSSALLVLGVAFSVGMLVSGRFLYLTRRRAPALAAGTVLVLGSPFFVTAWPWNVLSSPRWPSASPVDPSRISLTVARPSPPTSPGPVGRRLVEAWLRISGAPDGWAVVPFRVSSTLRLADGTIHRYDEPTRESRYIGYEFTPMGPWSAVGITHLLGARPGIVPGTATGAAIQDWATTRITAVPVADRRAPLRGELEAGFTCTAFRGVVEATLPLVPGSRGRTKDGSVHILAAGAGPRQSWADIFAVNVRTVTPRPLLPRPQRRLLYVLRNRQRAEWLAGHPGRPNVSSGPAWFAPTWVRYEAIEFMREAASGTPGDDWLRGAELVIVSFEEMGTFTKTVRVPDFEIPAVDPRTTPTGTPKAPD
jgi:hypothetical protein